MLDLAEAAGMRPTVLVRHSVLGLRLRRRPTAANGATLRALIDRDRQLARIGNNLNQLVRLAHGGRVRRGREFLRVMNQVLDELEVSRAEICDLADDLRASHEAET